jgi:hypothetical protein
MILSPPVVGERLADARGQVGLVDAGQGQRPGHGAEVGLQDPQQQMRRLQVLFAGSGGDASFQGELGRGADARGRVGVAGRLGEVEGAASYPGRAEAGLELPVQRVVIACWSSPTEVRAWCAVVPCWAAMASSRWCASMVADPSLLAWCPACSMIVWT